MHNLATVWVSQQSHLISSKTNCLIDTYLFAEIATPAPPTTTTTTTASTTSTSTNPSTSAPPTTNAPTTFQFAFNRNSAPSGSIWSGTSAPDVSSVTVTKRPSIALLPTSATSNGVNTNPYTRGGESGGVSVSTSSSSFVPNSTPSTVTSIRPSHSQKTKQSNKPHSTSKPTRPYEPPHLNEIPGVDGSGISKSHARSPNIPPFARLNMGGIIALGVFGGFVFLAAVITIIVIIIRR